MRGFILPILVICAVVQLGHSQLQYKWDYIQFEDLPRPENYDIDGSAYYNKENVFMTGIAYDSRTKYMCAAFPSLKPGNPVRIGCFDTLKYPEGSSPVFKPFLSYRDNDLPGWATPEETLGRSNSHRNFTNAFSEEIYDIDEDEDYDFEEVEVSRETARGLLSNLGGVHGSKGQKIIVVYNNPPQSHKHRRPRPPHSEEEENNEEEEETENEESLPDASPIPPPKRRRPPPSEEHSSEEEHYRPKPIPQQVIVIKDSKKKSVVLDFLSRVGSKLNPLNYFGGNRKDDLIVYVDRPPQRPRPPHKKRSKPTPAKTPIEEEPIDIEEDDPYTADIEIRATTPKPSPPKVTKVMKPAFIIKRPIVANNDIYAPYQLDSLRSLSEEASGEITRPYSFISIHRPYFDSCHRLWFIDTGSLEYNQSPVYYRKPTLWAFEVSRNKTTAELDSELYLRYEIPDSSYDGLRSLVVDIHGNCDFYHVYIPNQVDNQIVVYSSKKKTHWFFNHAILKPVTTEEPSQLKGGQGVSSLALGQRDSRGFRPVFITIASSLAQYKVSSKLLRDSSSSPDEFHFLSFKVLGYTPTAEYTTATAFDYKSSVLFMTTFPESTFNCWNTRKFLNPDSVGTLFSNNLLLNGRDVQIDREGNVLFLASNFDTFTSALSLRQGTNFQVFKFDTKRLIKGSICDPAKRDYRSLDVNEMVKEADVIALKDSIPEFKISSLKKEEEVPVKVEVKEE